MAIIIKILLYPHYKTHAHLLHQSIDVRSLLVIHFINKINSIISLNIQYESKNKYIKIIFKNIKINFNANMKYTLSSNSLLLSVHKLASFPFEKSLIHKK